MTERKINDDTQAEPRKNSRRKRKSRRMAPPTRGETLVKGVVMGFIISGVTHAGRRISQTLIGHPLALFSAGVATGILAHKYRKEIIILGSRTGEESKNFLLRQRENFLDLVAESQDRIEPKNRY